MRWREGLVSVYEVEGVSVGWRGLLSLYEVEGFLSLSLWGGWGLCGMEGGL